MTKAIDSTRITRIDATSINAALIGDSDSSCQDAESFCECILCEIGWSKPPASKSPGTSKSAEPSDGTKDISATKPEQPEKAAPPELSPAEAEWQRNLEKVRDPGAQYARLSGEELTQLLRTSDGSTATEIIGAIAGPLKEKDYSRYDCGSGSEFTQLNRLKQSLDKLSETDVVALVEKLNDTRTDPFAKGQPSVKYNVVDYWKDTYLKPNSQPASAEDYKAWLQGHLAKGGKVSHDYDYSMHGMLVLKKDMELPMLSGSSNLDVIVPKGINAKFFNESGQENGQSHLYFMDGFRTSGNFVPLYTNIK